MNLIFKLTNKFYLDWYELWSKLSNNILASDPLFKKQMFGNDSLFEVQNIEPNTENPFQAWKYIYY